MAGQRCPVSTQGWAVPKMALGRVSKPIWKAHIVGQRTSDCIESDDGVLLRLFGYMLARFYVYDSAAQITPVIWQV